MYQISLLPDNRGIQVQISLEARNCLSEYYTQETRYVESLGQLGLQPKHLIPYGGNVFGYHGVLELDDDIIRVPYCRDKLEYLSGSLAVLFRCLNCFKCEEIDPVEISATLSHQIGGYALGASFTAKFHSWLGKKYSFGSGSPLPMVEEAMIKTGKIIHQSDLWGVYVRANMNYDNEGFELHCDRNCCCMHAGNIGNLGNGLCLNTHNCDCSANQLTFLAGLAAIAMEYTSEVMVQD